MKFMYLFIYFAFASESVQVMSKTWEIRQQNAGILETAMSC
jgi:hypothetical protein